MLTYKLFQQFLLLQRHLIVSSNYSTVAIASLGKGKKKFGKGTVVAEKKILPVETDANKITTYLCGSNINKEGEDIKLLPDEEYPDWLWNLNIGKVKTLEELDPSTREYWVRARKEHGKRKSRLAKQNPF